MNLYGWCLKIPAWYRRRVALDGLRVAENTARHTLLVLRWLSYAVWVAALVIGGLQIHRWPRYKAEGMRVLVERHLAASVLSQQVYLQIVRGRQDQALKIADSPEGKTPSGTRHFLALDAIRSQMIDRAAAETSVIQRAQAARAQVPGRLSAGVLWADPISGVALPEGITRDEGVDRLLTHWRSLPEQEEWLRAVSAVAANHQQEHP